MDKERFYKGLMEDGLEALTLKKEVTPPKKISEKAYIIISAFASRPDGWDFTLEQLQEGVFTHRGIKKGWTPNGTFEAKDLIQVKDIEQALLEVYFNQQESNLWKGKMLHLVSHHGKMVVEKWPYMPDYFTLKKEKEEKKEDRKGSLIDDLVKLYEKNGDKYSAEDLKTLEDLIKKVGGEAVEFVA